MSQKEADNGYWESIISDFVSAYVDVVVKGKPERAENLEKELFPRLAAIFSDNPYSHVRSCVEQMTKIKDELKDEKRPMLREEARNEEEAITAMVFAGSMLARDRELLDELIRSLEVDWFKLAKLTYDFKALNLVRAQRDFLFLKLAEIDFEGIIRSFGPEENEYKDISSYLLELICHYSLTSRTDVSLVLKLSEIPLFKCVCGEARVTGRVRNYGPFREWLLAANWSSKRDAAVALINQILRRLKWKDVLDERIDRLFKVLRQLDDIVVYFEEEVFYEGFYRDHLNHLVRVFLVGLLLAWSTSKTDEKKRDLIADSVSLASVLHDIAVPAPRHRKIMTHVRRLLEEGFSCLDLSLRERLVDIAPKVKSIIPRENLHAVGAHESWESQDMSTRIEKWANSQIDIVTGIPSGGFLGGAIGSKHETPIDKVALLGVDHSIIAMTEYSLNQKTKFENCTDRLVLQAIALHSLPEDLGANIEMSKFPCAAITILADELQEWGRTVGSFMDSPIKDIDLNIKPNGPKNLVEISFSISHFDYQKNGFGRAIGFIGQKASSLGRIVYDEMFDLRMNITLGDIAKRFSKLQKLNSIGVTDGEGEKELRKPDFDFYFLESFNELLAVPASLFEKVPPSFLLTNLRKNGGSTGQLALVFERDGKERVFQILSHKPENYHPNYETVELIDWSSRKPMLYELKELK